MPDKPDQTSAQASVRLHAVVQGKVQGVYFRATTQREAVRCQLTGWVHNRWDGTVETIAEGPRYLLEEFERYLQHGPPSAHVKKVEITYHPATGEFNRFNIRY